MSMHITWQGLQETQRTNFKQLAALSPIGAMGRAIQYGLAAASRYAMYVTHVWTGALRASHRVQYTGGYQGFVYIDPSAGGFEYQTKIGKSGRVSTRRQYSASRATPAEYGPVEHARGGSHAFYELTQNQGGPGISEGMAAILRAEL
jgi:hypothetical protein